VLFECEAGVFERPEDIFIETADRMGKGIGRHVSNDAGRRLELVLTTNGVSNDVSIIDVANLRIIKTIQVGELPWGIAISQQ
jgi:YVTN family beta-propeller protein